MKIDIDNVEKYVIAIDVDGDPLVSCGDFQTAVDEIKELREKCVRFAQERIELLHFSDK